MDISRRGFFGNLFLGGAGVILGTTEVSAKELLIPIVNPRFTTDLTAYNLCDDISYSTRISSRGIKYEYFENDNLKISIKGDTRIIELKKPIDTQSLYSAMKWIWKDEINLQSHPFPMTAITPEMFETVEGWYISPTMLRGGGIATFESYDEPPRNQYIALSVLSQEGMIYDSRGIELKNSALLEINDGKVKGFYRKNHGEKLIDLQTHLEKTIGVKELTYQMYRIP